MVVIDMSTFVKPPPIQDSPVAYESRCIVNDARRAAMMKEAPEKCCFWDPGTVQWELWMREYILARGHRRG